MNDIQGLNNVKVKEMYVKSLSVVNKSATFEETKVLGIRYWPCKNETFRFTISCRGHNRKYEKILFKLLCKLPLM